MALIRPRARPIQLVRPGAGSPVQGLAAFFGFQSNASFWDSVTGKPGTVDANQTRCPVEDGGGLQYNGSARVVYTNLATPAAVSGQFVTIVARMKLVTKPASRCA